MRRFVFALSLCLFQTQVWSAEIVVAAATSLTDAFKVLEQGFEKKYPNIKVNIIFASSGILLQQLRNGAPIDVLATADQKTMNDAQKYRLIHPQTRTDFAANQLVLIAPSNSRLSIKGLNDLAKNDVRYIAIGNPTHTPAGRYAQAVLKKQSYWSAIQPKLIKTQNVRHALDYVARGETELGFVFATDVFSQKGKVKVLMNVPTIERISYPIAVTQKTSLQSEAQTFIQYIKSPMGQQVLQRYGFNP